MSNSNEKTVVMAFGTFDYFHAGHEDYLKQAKALGDELVVVIAKDDTVRKVKSKKPMYSERKRLRDVSNNVHVDKAILGNADDKYKVIRKIKPNVLALGYDQFVFTYGLKQLFIQEKMNTKIVRLSAFSPQTFKSSLIQKSLSTTKECDPLTATSLKD
jgi:FAD synthetase